MPSGVNPLTQLGAYRLVWRWGWWLLLVLPFGNGGSMPDGTEMMNEGMEWNVE